jgi:glyoxylase-like metal-dependent hydrolase (beta-lactamase superfamily II)
MILETVIVSPMEVNCYILASKDGGKAIIIDPGSEQHKIQKALDAHKLNVAFVINTHGHFDHIGCDDAFGVPVYIHSQDMDMLKDAKKNFSAFFEAHYSIKSLIKPLKDGEIIELDDIKLEVLHVPGHTSGGIALLMKKPQNRIVFTGDSLFCEGVGRTDLGGDEGLLIDSIKDKLLVLPDDTVIYPGHGPSSTIGQEKLNNPFLN